MTRQLRYLIVTTFFAALTTVLYVGGDARGQDAAPTANVPGPVAPADRPLGVKPDPAVDTIVDSNPQTPAQLLNAAAILADLDRADLAKKYLKQLSEAKHDVAVLAEAAGQIEPRLLLRLAGNAELQPAGRQLADAVFAAAARQARDPQRLQTDINQLLDPSRVVQQQALTKILAAHEDAVPALVLALADPNRAAVHPLVRQALVKIAEQAVPPLVATLATDNAALKIQIIETLAQIGSPKAVLYLAASATAENSSAAVREAARAALEAIQGSKNPTRPETIKLLTGEIDRLLKHERPLTVDPAGNVDVWRWDSAAGVPVREALPVEHASAAMAARLADDLLKLAPDDPHARRLFLISTLEAAEYRAGLDHPLPQGAGTEAERAGRLGAAALEDALRLALETGHLPAATAAAEVLGTIGDASLLRAKGPQVRPLVQAVSQGDRRLRFAAAEAIMKFKPTAPFAGSSDLLAALVYFADSPGAKRAVVAFPNEAVATQLAAMLAALGYEADIATNGRRTYLQAISSGDYEVLLLSGRLDRPPVWVVLQQLRREPRTARLPIALLAEDGDVENLQSLVAGDRMSTVFGRPVDPTGMKFHVERLVNRAGGEIVPPEVRQRQALAALGWLKELNAASPRDFDLHPYEVQLTRALHRPATSVAAAESLAAIGAHSAQKSLVDLASTSIEPLEARQAAAAAFSRAVRKYGIQLTSAEIRQQYDRYNQSALEDQATQQLLGLILDALELPTKPVAAGAAGK